MSIRRLLGAIPAFVLLLGAPLAAQLEDQIPAAQLEALERTVSQGQASARVLVFVELQAPPAAKVYAAALRESGARTEASKRRAGAIAREQVLINETAVARLASEIESLGGDEVYRVTKALNGVATWVTPDRLKQLERLPGVRRVLPIEQEYPTNSTSVPFLGTPAVWENSLGLPAGALGTGVSIAVIDTGVDYQHADLGGSGLLADYQANDRTVLDGFFPTAKVVGGTDFAGDGYTGANAPAPDPDPMDCNGHGSHVTGSAAGFGVNADGTTYTGPYTTSAAYAGLRIGPGTAPQASVYGLRVFGCGGSTGLTVQAINWAMDPNGDSDLSDHLDVINMSLGSNFGVLASTSALASDNAAEAGVIVVASAGNAGDTFFISGSPGSGSHVIATASTLDSGLPGAVLVVNAPVGIAGNYAASATNTFAPAPAPAPAGQTAAIVIGLDPADGAGPLTTDGCSPLTNAAAILGNIAMIDRGTCGFQVKANNAQAAGAIGVIIANNAVGDPNLIAMGATGAVPVTVPTVMISQADRNTIAAQLPGVNATLAAATAADTISSFSSRGPRGLFDSPMRLKPDIAAPGQSIVSMQTGVTCTGVAPSTGCQVANASGFIPASAALNLSGTSMAAPHVAGIMALLRELHPTWTGDELKALAMNYAIHDVTIGANGSGPQFGNSRVGAGRVDPPAAAVGSVIAFNEAEPELVSATVDGEVIGAVASSLLIRVVNHGASAATYDLAIDNTVDAPGAAFSVGTPSPLTIPPGDSVVVTVDFNATTSAMDHARETTQAPAQTVPAPASLAGLGAISRHWLTQESSYLTFSQSGNLRLRVPLYFAGRPTSAMSAPPTIITGGAPSGSTTIPLSGTDVCSGTLAAGPICNGTFPNDEVSLVSAFELQGTSPRETNLFGAQDLQYVGVAADAARIWWGLSTWGDWGHPNDFVYVVSVDNNLDGTFDRHVLSTNTGFLARSYFGATTTTNTDVFISSVFTPPGTFSNLVAAGLPGFLNGAPASGVDSALHLNNVMFFGATPAQLGIVDVNATFRYRVLVCPGISLPGLASNCTATPTTPSDTIPDTGFLTWNGAARGLDFAGTLLRQDLNGGLIPVTWNTANMATNGTLGALLLHHHNGAGNRAEVVLLDASASADLTLTKSVTPPGAQLGDNVTFTLTLTNGGPDAASGIVVSDLLPAGLTYVSDNGAGSYNSATGDWTTAGPLAAAGSVSLQIVATVDTTDAVCNVATVSVSSPLDPDPSDNTATSCVTPDDSSDLVMTVITTTPSVVAGNPATYVLTVTNSGDDTAFSVDVNDTFIAGVDPGNPTTAVASTGFYNPGTGHWDVASLGNGASATLTLTFTTASMAGPLTLQGVAGIDGVFPPPPPRPSSRGAQEADPVGSNNTAQATVVVSSPGVISGFTKTVSGTFIPGGTVTYTVTLTNSGATAQLDNPGNEFTDTLPASLTLTGASATSGTATTAGNTANWNGSIPAAGSVTITLTATINAGAVGVITNQGTVNSDPNGDGVNDTVTLTDDPAVAGTNDPTSFTSTSSASISTRTKTVTGSFVPGGVVTYTIVITNSAASAQLDNPGDEFIDILPASLILQSASATSGTPNANLGANTVTWNGGLAANGGTVTITINALISSAAGGATVSNQGTIQFDADGNGTNESSLPTDDPSVGGISDPTAFGVSGVLEIPALDWIGLLALISLLAFGALRVLRRGTAK